jgi:hypothetical protein
MNDQENKQTEPTKSKYELTLSEFPIFILSKKVEEDIKAITYEDTIVGKDYEIVKREWRVFPDAEVGFGTASTFETLFDLFQIWREQGFRDPFIKFGTVYHLLKRRGENTGHTQYKQLIKDLTCLVGVRIQAKNAFWDNEKKAYVDMTFHLFDRLDLFKDKTTGQATLPFARIKASDILFGSVLKNSLLTADFDGKFFHSLAPVEQRLALYLSKVFRSQAIHKREMSLFAQQVPIYAKQVKHVKERIKKASSGLLAKGFKLLKSFDFEKAADGQTELVVFRRNNQAADKIFKAPARQLPAGDKESYEVDLLVQDILEVCQDQKSQGFYRQIARLLPRQDIYQALSEVKEIRDTGEVRTSKGAIFTSLIKRRAQAQGIEL